MGMGQGTRSREVKSNITDNESAKMTTSKGTIQGYNGIVVTADTGYSNEANNAYLKEEGNNAYMPDNQFRSRDPKFKQQKAKHGKRHQDKVKGIQAVIPASEFTFDRQQKPASARPAPRCGCAAKPTRLQADSNSLSRVS